MLTASESQVFHSQALCEDPYGLYESIRAHGDVHWVEESECWLVLGYPLVDYVHRSKDFGVDPDDITVKNAVIEQQEQHPGGRRKRSLLRIDPPDHTRIRRVLHDGMPDALVSESMRVTQAVARQSAHLSGDIVAGYGEPAIAAGLGYLISRDPEYLASTEVLGWIRALNRIVDPIHSEDDWLRADRAAGSLRRHMRAVLERPGRPDDGLAGPLRAAIAAAAITADEAIDQIVLLAVNGLGTTVWLFTNALAAAAQAVAGSPGPAGLTWDEPFVEEALHYDGPTQFGRRIARRDLELAGELIRQGSVVLTALGSANRDPGAWGPTASVFRPGRSGRARLLSFGGGVHYCLGANIAKAQVSVLGKTLETMSAGWAVDDTMRLMNRMFRGYASMRVSVRGGAGS